MELSILLAGISAVFTVVCALLLIDIKNDIEEYISEEMFIKRQKAERRVERVQR